jgi:hypothetical protein
VSHTDEPLEDELVELSKDELRRIVACVNACRGIPTEALEAGVIGQLWADSKPEEDLAGPVSADCEGAGQEVSR